MPSSSAPSTTFSPTSLGADLIQKCSVKHGFNDNGLIDPYVTEGLLYVNQLVESSDLGNFLLSSSFVSFQKTIICAINEILAVNVSIDKVVPSSVRSLKVSYSWRFTFAYPFAQDDSAYLYGSSVASNITEVLNLYISSGHFYAAYGQFCVNDGGNCDSTSFSQLPTFSSLILPQLSQQPSTSTTIAPTSSSPPVKNNSEVSDNGLVTEYVLIGVLLFAFCVFILCVYVVSSYKKRATAPTINVFSVKEVPNIGDLYRDSEIGNQNKFAASNTQSAAGIVATGSEEEFYMDSEQVRNSLVRLRSNSRFSLSARLTRSSLNSDMDRSSVSLRPRSSSVTMVGLAANNLTDTPSLDEGNV